MKIVYLLAILALFPRFLLGDTDPVAIIKNYINKAEVFQNKNLTGRAYQLKINIQLAEKTEERILNVKYYDKLNWIVAKKIKEVEFIVGRNDSYFFVIEKRLNGNWKKNVVTKPPTDKEFLSSHHFEYHAMHPLTILPPGELIGYLDDVVGFENIRYVKDDISELNFNTYYNNKKGEKTGPVSCKLIIRENPTWNLSVFESSDKSVLPIVNFSTIRKFGVNSEGGFESINVEGWFKYASNDLVTQKLTYSFADFKKLDILPDNYLQFYGISEPSGTEYGYQFLFSTPFNIIGGLIFMAGLSGVFYYRFLHR